MRYLSDMNIEARKLHLIALLTRTEDVRLLTRIERLVGETATERYKREFGNGSADSLIQMVKEGEEDIAAGRTYTSDEVATYFRNKRK